LSEELEPKQEQLMPLSKDEVKKVSFVDSEVTRSVKSYSYLRKGLLGKLTIFSTHENRFKPLCPMDMVKWWRVSMSPS
jgi:hypothetical protein